MIGHEIFRCDIQNLQFNTESDLDPVSQRAVEACLQASRKFRRARTHFWLRSLLEHRVFMQYGPKDYSPIEVNLKKYASCLECVNCCGILVPHAALAAGGALTSAAHAALAAGGALTQQHTPHWRLAGALTSAAHAALAAGGGTDLSSSTPHWRLAGALTSAAARRTGG
ncbi:hypothetical protein MSG28_007266 [Choristoneura fumiferana]|uniref:Uncharacterized protein n=1 Tax=Choristoneura fumiferana TaxID=7141 RepID=A0ACC0JWM6_CHOFU|nr:hypothetical protein MSG28_007266 [Choristoneura fumiferana]